MRHIPDHWMSETQATLRWTGSLEAPERAFSLRAGKVQCRSRRGRLTQRAVALPLDASMQAAARALEQAASVMLERFHGLGAAVELYGLIRERRVSSAPDEPQRFRGFWGALDAPNAWRSVFGLGPEGELAFRRGAWEEWPTDLPVMTQLPSAPPIVFSPYCGTLLHEALGHALEAEYLPDSPLRRRLGEKLASSRLTVMDRPDLAGHAGAMTRDDAGEPASATTLVQQGVLVGDLDHGRGALRRGSYRDPPLVRAANFLVAKGGGDPRSWLADLPECLYVCWVQSGNWKPGQPKFKALTGPVFHLRRGEPVAWMAWTVLRLSILEMLAGIEDVGDDLCIDPATHWCVKKNQPVPIGMGSPSLLVRGLSS